MQKTLWIATLDVGYTYLIFPFYAANEDEAKEKVASLEAENGARCTSLQDFRCGFRIVHVEMPGSVEAAEEQGRSEEREKAGF
jgi:hypothetical protein